MRASRRWGLLRTWSPLARAPSRRGYMQGMEPPASCLNTQVPWSFLQSGVPPFTSPTVPSHTQLTAEIPDRRAASLWGPWGPGQPLNKSPAQAPNTALPHRLLFLKAWEAGRAGSVGRSGSSLKPPLGTGSLPPGDTGGSGSEDRVGREASPGGWSLGQWALRAVSRPARWPPQGGTWTQNVREGSATRPLELHKGWGRWAAVR